MAGQAKPFRSRIEIAVREARAARPGCRLDSDVTVDKDGRVWVEFTCVNHGSQWREVVAQVMGGPPCDPETTGAPGLLSEQG